MGRARVAGAGDEGALDELGLFDGGDGGRGGRQVAVKGGRVVVVI